MNPIIFTHQLLFPSTDQALLSLSELVETPGPPNSLVQPQAVASTGAKCLRPGWQLAAFRTEGISCKKALDGIGFRRFQRTYGYSQHTLMSVDLRGSNAFLPELSRRLWLLSPSEPLQHEVHVVVQGADALLSRGRFRHHLNQASLEETHGMLKPTRLAIASPSLEDL